MCIMLIRYSLVSMSCDPGSIPDPSPPQHHLKELTKQLNRANQGLPKYAIKTFILHVQASLGWVSIGLLTW